MMISLTFDFSALTFLNSLTRGILRRHTVVVFHLLLKFSKRGFRTLNKAFHIVSNDHRQTRRLPLRGVRPLSVHRASSLLSGRDRSQNAEERLSCPCPQLLLKVDAHPVPSFSLLSAGVRRCCFVF